MFVALSERHWLCQTVNTPKRIPLKGRVKFQPFFFFFLLFFVCLFVFLCCFQAGIKLCFTAHLCTDFKRIMRFSPRRKIMEYRVLSCLVCNRPGRATIFHKTVTSVSFFFPTPSPSQFFCLQKSLLFLRKMCPYRWNHWVASLPVPPRNQSCLHAAQTSKIFAHDFCLQTIVTVTCKHRSSSWLKLASNTFTMTKTGLTKLTRCAGFDWDLENVTLVELCTLYLLACQVKLTYAIQVSIVCVPCLLSAY